MKIHRYLSILAAILILIGTVDAKAAEVTDVNDIRFGRHQKFTRLVMDAKGPQPVKIETIAPDKGQVVFQKLNLLTDLSKLPISSSNPFAGIGHSQETKSDILTVTFRKPGTRMKYFFLPTIPPKANHYRLVLDAYPPEKAPAAETVAAQPAASSTQTPLEAQTVTSATVKKSSTTGVAAPTAPVVLTAASTSAPPLDEKDLVVAQNASPTDAAPSTPATEEPETEDEAGPDPIFEAEVSLIGQLAIDEDESAKFEEYRDVSQPVTGDLWLHYEMPEDYRVTASAEDVAGDDRFGNFEAEKYSTGAFKLQYREIPHLYAIDARTLYTGVGSDRLLIDDAIQANLEATPGNIVSIFQSNATKGDPEVSRKIFEAEADVWRLSPFEFRIEFSREEREGTRPLFGSFGNNTISGYDTVELPAPVDYETTQIKLIGEYVQKPWYVNASYYYSNFSNNVDALVWDNPFRASDDAVLGPETGRMDLPPDNHYHNLALSGVYSGLPYRTKVSATAAFGRMEQDDNFIPHTTNTALAPGPLPANKVNAEVNTYLYRLNVTSRPTPRLHLKGQVRYYEYDNQTDRLTFTSWVPYDSFVNAVDDISNLPSSYKKFKANAAAGYDIYNQTRLTLEYTFDQIERTNREVDRQYDHIGKISLDTRVSPMLDVRLSYERTQREIDDYDFDVYLLSGQDLAKEPLLRKYTQADMNRDRIALHATAYPHDAVVFSGTLIYGKDDFHNSPFGLLEDEHWSASFDADFALDELTSIYAFYSYEYYRNRQRGLGTNVAPFDDEWLSESEDMIHTLGVGLNRKQILDRLDFDISYAYTFGDGDLDFFTPAFTTADFGTVDETELHILKTNLVYQWTDNISIGVGHLWEKFEYDDFNVQDFTNTPDGAVLLGTLPEDYDSHVFYGKITYRY